MLSDSPVSTIPELLGLSPPFIDLPIPEPGTLGVCLAFQGLMQYYCPAITKLQMGSPSKTQAHIVPNQKDRVQNRGGGEFIHDKCFYTKIFTWQCPRNHSLSEVEGAPRHTLPIS